MWKWWPGAFGPGVNSDQYPCALVAFWTGTRREESEKKIEPLRTKKEEKRKEEKHKLIRSATREAK